MNFDWMEAMTSVQGMANGFMERLPYFAIALVVFTGFVFIGKGIRSVVLSINVRNRKHYNIGLVLGRLSNGLIIFIGLLIALVIAIPGFTPGQLVNLLGLSSVAIGFAFRDILQNFLAGILILLTQPFRIGDQIVLDEFEGTVENIETRATFIRTYDSRRIVIPNSKLFTDPVIVNTANEKRRLQYDIGIGYSDDIARAKDIMLDMVRGIPEVLRDPAPDAIVVELAGSTVNIRLRWWVQPPRQYDTLHSTDVVLEKVKNALVKDGIDLAFPTQQILFHDQTEETDGDRSRQREGWPQGSRNAPSQARIVDGIRASRPMRHHRNEREAENRMDMNRTKQAPTEDGQNRKGNA
ncbi:mechanosensitive ion channel family protein [Noviherbaspirillum sp.]|uniref:mechanosensitive ion channel family protein n=1 Tax=Noviherbaspirillum sp. TaxID=1926288 RepID=UPI002FE3388F